jgi:hypothetical protein
MLLGAVCGDALASPLSASGSFEPTTLDALEDGDTLLRHSAAAELMLAAASFYALRPKRDALSTEDLTYALALTWWREHNRAGYSREDQDRFSRALDLERPAEQESDGPSCDPAPLIGGALALRKATPAQLAILAGASVTATGEPLEACAEPAGSERAGAARVSASALARVLASDPLREFDTDRWLARLREVASSAVATALKLVPQPVPGAVARETGWDGTAHIAVITAIQAFLACPGSVEGCVRVAIETGGRNTVAAALAGALAGARLGAKAVPRTWVGRLEDPVRVFDIADRLAVHRVHELS